MEAEPTTESSCRRRRPLPSTPAIRGSKARNISAAILLLALLYIFPQQAFAEPTYVHHQQTMTPVYPNCDRYVDAVNPSPLQDYRLRFRAGVRYTANVFLVYYTTDGSTPSGSFGVPSGTTRVIAASYLCGYYDPDFGESVNVAYGIIPGQPLGTVVKYVVSAYDSSGGRELFGNSRVICPDQNCPPGCNGSSCATVFSFTPCTFSLSPTSQSYPAAGGMGTINVTTGNNCRWSVMDDWSFTPYFVDIISGSGQGNGVITYSVRQNTTTGIQIGRLRVAGEVFSIYQGKPFYDVPTSHPFYTFIGKLSAREVTQGCTPVTYCPEALVTREQMAVFIIRALGMFDPPLPTQQRFADVGPDRFGYRFIEELARREITLGCNSENFCPDAPVTREQMAAFIIRALGMPDPPPPASQRFLDVPPDNPFYGFIEQMAIRQITSGCGSNIYCPQGFVTRGQMAAFLVRAFGL